MPQKDFYKLCRGGQIRVNSKRVHGQEILRTGDVVRVPPTVASYAKIRITGRERSQNDKGQD